MKANSKRAIELKEQGIRANRKLPDGGREPEYRSRVFARLRTRDDIRFYRV